MSFRQFWRENWPLWRVLAALASTGCLALLWFRVHISAGSLLYRWLVVPNLALAWIPLLCAVALRYVWRRKPAVTVSAVAFFALWLLFLPNAPYVVTDLVHLTYLKSKVPAHYDVLLNAFTALTALVAGHISLYVVHELLLSRLHAWSSWLVVAGLLALSSVGVYIGRFLRWNSWDLFHSPLAIAGDSLHVLTQREALLFIGLFAFCQIFSYLVVYTCLRFRAAES